MSSVDGISSWVSDLIDPRLVITALVVKTQKVIVQLLVVLTSLLNQSSFNKINVFDVQSVLFLVILFFEKAKLLLKKSIKRNWNFLRGEGVEIK